MVPLQHAREFDEMLKVHPSWRSVERTERETECEVIIARRYAKFTCGSERSGTLGAFGFIVSGCLDEGTVTGASVAGLVRRRVLAFILRFALA